MDLQTREDMALVLKTNITDLLQLCICYGFHYAYATDRKNVIDKDKNKKARATTMISDTPFFEFYKKYLSF
jgi:hypothetical protein